MSELGKAYSRGRKLRDRINAMDRAVRMLKRTGTPQQQIWYAAELLTSAAELLRDGGLAMKALHIAELSQGLQADRNVRAPAGETSAPPLQPGRPGTAAPLPKTSGAAGSDLPPTAASVFTKE
jgi:hypothetical protein